MERAEYERMHAVEDRMWWYRGLRALAAQLLARALAGSPAAGPVLDAGCGTGGMLLKLGPTVAGRATLGLEYDVLAAALAASKAGRPVAAGSVNEMPLSDGDFQQLVAFLRHQYSATYTPSNTFTDGKFRKIKVELVAPDGGPLVVTDQKGKKQKVVVYAREGYTAPKGGVGD